MTTKSAEAEPFIQLSLIANPVVHAHLTALDASADGRLSFAEVAHRTVLTPSDESSFVFTEKDDIKRYNRLVASSANAFIFTRFRDQYPLDRTTAPSAEEWLADAGESLLAADPLYTTTYNGGASFYLWDFVNSPGEELNLLMEYHGYLPALPGFFFTLRFPADSHGSDARTLTLDPATSGEALAKLVHLLKSHKKCRATTLEQRVHDPFYGNFHNIFAYDSGIDLEGDGTDERVLLEEKVSYDTPGQRWDATLRIVVLKKTADGRTARLTDEVSVGGPLSVADFMAHGVEPIFGGLYVVNSQGRDFLRIRSRLGWNADFHLLESEGEFRLVKHVNRLP